MFVADAKLISVYIVFWHWIWYHQHHILPAIVIMWLFEYVRNSTSRCIYFKKFVFQIEYTRDSHEIKYIPRMHFILHFKCANPIQAPFK